MKKSKKNLTDSYDSNYYMVEEYSFKEIPLLGKLIIAIVLLGIIIPFAAQIASKIYNW